MIPAQREAPRRPHGGLDGLVVFFFCFFYFLYIPGSVVEVTSSYKGSSGTLMCVFSVVVFFYFVRFVREG